MSAKIQINGSLLEQIDVNDGSRQGRCMSPVLFNLFSCTLLERWKQILNGVDGVGVRLYTVIRNSIKDIPGMQINVY